MKIAVLGGGITGLTAAYTLTKKKNKVTLFEKSPVLGGLAVGFKQPNWNWHLERAYHHLFANDYDIINFAKETGFNKIFFKTPETASIFGDLGIHPMDTPLDFLKLPHLNLFNKFRAGFVLAFLKFTPFLSLFEKITAKEFIKKTMGKIVWKRLWQELFRKKFGDYAGIILASFIWARITKRTKNLGYIEGGFQTFINHLVKESRSLRVNVLTGYEIKEIKKRGAKYLINGQIFDVVISTLPTPVMVKLTSNLFPKKYLERFSKLKYLHALTLILETNQPLLKKTYWLNVSAPQIPIMGIIQHTNFIDKKHYGGSHIAYLGWYLKRDDRLFALTKEELLKFVLPYLKILNTKYKILNTYNFKGSFAQPIFDKDFVKNKPDFKTPLKNFYIANLDMTYPYDRGTNYAVKLGKQVAAMI
ncbi:FAD-dependent oxidoreductase [Candidatus Roizmanbacteria bacterium]|nr:FAD-dependent oxidoreductase [Candidatus Roizmanbacteria bacterium]